MHSALMLETVLQVGEMRGEEGRDEGGLDRCHLKFRKGVLHLLFMPILVFGEFAKDKVSDEEGDRRYYWFSEMVPNDSQAVSCRRMVP